VLRVSSRNARFQQWQALLGNRNKRQRAGEFLVQGVRPISLAARFGWPFRALIYDAQRPLSQWAQALLRDAGAMRVPMAPELLAELGEKDEGVPELVAVVEMPADDLGRIEAGDGFLGVVLDRLASPGNVGSIIRSADAFGARGVIVTGHAADIYDPRCVRASTGSLFALPVVRAPGPREVIAWVAAHRARGCPVVLAAADERVARGGRRGGPYPDGRRGKLTQCGGRGNRPAVRGSKAAPQLILIYLRYAPRGQRRPARQLWSLSSEAGRQRRIRS